MQGNNCGLVVSISTTRAYSTTSPDFDYGDESYSFVRNLICIHPTFHIYGLGLRASHGFTEWIKYLMLVPFFRPNLL